MANHGIPGLAVTCVTRMHSLVEARGWALNRRFGLTSGTAAVLAPGGAGYIWGWGGMEQGLVGVRNGGCQVGRHCTKSALTVAVSKCCFWNPAPNFPEPNLPSANLTLPPPHENRERIIVGVRSPCQENYPADAHPGARKSVLEPANRHGLGVGICRHLVNGTGNSPSPGHPTPGVVKQDKSSGGFVGRGSGVREGGRVCGGGGRRRGGRRKERGEGQ